MFELIEGKMTFFFIKPIEEVERGDDLLSK